MSLDENRMTIGRIVLCVFVALVAGAFTYMYSQSTVFTFLLAVVGFIVATWFTDPNFHKSDIELRSTWVPKHPPPPPD